MIPEPNTHASGEEKVLLGEALSAVREEIRDTETGLANPASVGQFRTPTGNAGIHEISSAPQCSLTTVSACQGPPRNFTYFSDAPADQGQEVLEIASGVGPDLALSEHGPCLVGGTVTLDDVSFTTKFAIHIGGDAIQVRGAPRYWFPPKPSSDVASWIVCFW